MRWCHLPRLFGIGQEEAAGRERELVAASKPEKRSGHGRICQELYYFNKMHLAIYSEIGPSNHLYRPSKYCLQKVGPPDVQIEAVTSNSPMASVKL